MLFITYLTDSEVAESTDQFLRVVEMFISCRSRTSCQLNLSPAQPLTALYNWSAAISIRRIETISAGPTHFCQPCGR